MRALKLGALLSILGVTGICCAANAEEPALLGVFTNPTQSDEPIKAVIETTVRDLNFIIRPVARSRLKKTNSALKRVAITREGANLVITLGTGNPTKTEPGHAPIKWTRDDGEVYDVSTEWQGKNLLQMFSTGDGQRENSFVLSADGVTLNLNVTLSSPQLKAPMRYELVFRRE